jgi:hypothetical protein
MPPLHAAFEPTFASDRTKVLPGCTGLWQIGDQNDRLITEAPEFDRYYMEHRTFRLDLWIIGRSIRGLLPGAVRVGLDDIPRWTGASATAPVVEIFRPIEVRIDTTDPATRFEASAIGADA